MSEANSGAEFLGELQSEKIMLSFQHEGGDLEVIKKNHEKKWRVGYDLLTEINEAAQEAIRSKEFPGEELLKTRLSGLMIIRGSLRPYSPYRYSDYFNDKAKSKGKNSPDDYLVYWRKIRESQAEQLGPDSTQQESLWLIDKFTEKSLSSVELDTILQGLCFSDQFQMAPEEMFNLLAETVHRHSK